MNFSLILAIEFSKKKNMEVSRIENFQLTAYLINTLLFARNKQTEVKTEVRKQPLK